MALYKLMRILLIHPPNSKESIAPGRFEPLALEILAACVPEHETKILDLRIDNLRKLDHLLNTFSPDIAGITINNAIHVNPGIQVINRINHISPEVRVIVGGFHATMMTEDFRFPGIHAVFLGWAEKSFPAYVSLLGNGGNLMAIDGIEVLDAGRILFHNDPKWDLKASDIPIPRRDLIRSYQNKYRTDMGFRTSMVNTTRGCPNKCSFCGVWQVSGGHFLLRDPEDIFKEIAGLPSNIQRVFFADDNTFIRPAYASRLCQLILEAGIRKKYSGYCRSDTISHNPDLMKNWKKAGLDNLCVGFECTDNERLDVLNKKNTLENNARAAEILNETGIPFRPHFLIECSFVKDDFSRIIRFVQEHRLKSPIFPILTPIPGTRYYQEVKDNLILGYEYFDFAHATSETKMELRDFYKTWIGMYKTAYPIWRNLRYALLELAGRIMGNKDMQKKYAHMDLINLLLLRFFGMLLHFKLSGIVPICPGDNDG